MKNSKFNVKNISHSLFSIYKAYDVIVYKGKWPHKAISHYFFYLDNFHKLWDIKVCWSLAHKPDKVLVSIEIYWQLKKIKYFVIIH